MKIPNTKQMNKIIGECEVCGKPIRNRDLVQPECYTDICTYCNRERIADERSNCSR